MRSERLLLATRLPAEEHLPVSFGDREPVEGRQDAADLLTDPLVALRVLLLQPVEDSGQIAAVAAELIAVALDVPLLLEGGRVRRVVELVDGTASEQTDDDTGRHRVDGVGVGYLCRLHDCGLAVTVTRVLPPCGLLESFPTVSKGLVGREETVRVRVSERESDSRFGPGRSVVEARPG